MVRGAVLLVALAAACGDRGGAAGPSAPRRVADGDGAPRPGTARAADAEPPMDEGPARRLLAGRFRVAGLRIVEDVALTSPVAITLDGFDPERRVGFEYVATAEAGDLAAEDRAALERAADPRVLVLAACGPTRCAAAADAFLAALPASPRSQSRP